MNKTTIRSFHASAVAAAFGACALLLATGCAAGGAFGHRSVRSETELRGVLTLPATNAPAEVVAVLQSRGGTRVPCNLRTSDGEVAADIRAFAAKGAVVLVTGEPSAEVFTVTAIRADGKPRRVHEGDADTAEKKEGFWPNVKWGSVPVQDK